MSLPLLATGALLLGGCSSLTSLWSGDTVESGITKVSAGAPIALLWQRDVDQRKPASPPGFSQPAVVADGLIAIGGQDKRLRVYSADGRELTRLALASEVESGGLMLGNGLMVVGDVSGNLYALDIKQGLSKWHYTLGSSLIGKPVAVGHDFIVQTSNNQIYRFSQHGKKVWSYSAQLGGLAMHLTPSPVVHNGHVYAAFSNGDVVALNAANGGFLWKRQTVLDNEAAVLSELKVPVSTPVVVPSVQSGASEDMLIVPVFQGQMIFMSLIDGSTLKTRDLSLKSSPLLVGNKLFVADAGGAVSVLDAMSGDTLWKKQISDAELTGPVLFHGQLWLADANGYVYRMDQAGKHVSNYSLNGRIDRAPVVSAAGVLVRNNLGILYMLR